MGWVSCVQKKGKMGNSLALKSATKFFSEWVAPVAKMKCECEKILIAFGMNVCGDQILRWWWYMDGWCVVSVGVTQALSKCAVSCMRFQSFKFLGA